MNIRLPLAKSLSHLAGKSVRTDRIRYALLFSACAATIAVLFFAVKFGALAYNQDVTDVSQSDLAEQSSAPPLANLALVIKVGQDGLAALNSPTDTLNNHQPGNIPRLICPTPTTPGCDFTRNNRIVRTNDSVTYSYEYSVNGGDEAFVTVVATAPPGSFWDPVFGVPAFCAMPGSSLNNGDG